MTAAFFTLMLVLLLGLGVLDLLLPSLAWRLHVWSKRLDGITGIERTRQWEWLRVVRGSLMLLLAGVLLLLYANFEDPLPPDAAPFDMPAGIEPSRVPPEVLEGTSPEELEDLMESLQGVQDEWR